MTKTEFISLLEEYLEKTGMSCGNWDAFLSVGDEENRNTTIYVDKEGFFGSLLMSRLSESKHQ